MDYDPGCASPTADEDSEAVFRPPLRGVRKRLDTGSLAGETSKVRSRDTPEYKRITEMIGELVDLRARIEMVLVPDLVVLRVLGEFLLQNRYVHVYLRLLPGTPITLLMRRVVLRRRKRRERAGKRARGLVPIIIHRVIRN